MTVPWLTQPSIPPGPPLAGKATAGMVHSISGLTRGWQVKLCDHLKMRALPQHFCDGVGYIKCRLTCTFTCCGWTQLSLQVQAAVVSVEGQGPDSTAAQILQPVNLMWVCGTTDVLMWCVYIHCRKVVHVCLDRRYHQCVLRSEVERTAVTQSHGDIGVVWPALPDSSHNRLITRVW